MKIDDQSVGGDGGDLIYSKSLQQQHNILHTKRGFHQL